MREVAPAVDRTQQRLAGLLDIEWIGDDRGRVGEVVPQQVRARVLIEKRLNLCPPSVDPNRWIVPGITDLGEVNEALGINLPTEEYDTFGGYVIDGLGEIPKDGLTAELDCDGLHIEVLKIYHHRVEICRVTLRN